MFKEIYAKFVINVILLLTFYLFLILTIQKCDIIRIILLLGIYLPICLLEYYICIVLFFNIKTNKQFLPSPPRCVSILGDRLCFPLQNNTIVFVDFLSSEGRFVQHVQTTFPIQANFCVLLDADTAALGDVNGIITLIRVTPQSDDVIIIARYDCGSTIVGLCKSYISQERPPALFYSTISGERGVFIPPQCVESARLLGKAEKMFKTKLFGNGTDLVCCDI